MRILLCSHLFHSSVGGIEQVSEVLATEFSLAGHTSNTVYVRLLSRHGIHAKNLPLFGSVPVLPNAVVTPRDDNTLRLSLFGSVHPEWSPAELFARLQALAKSIDVYHIGRIGPF
jgi:hypothetical protein